MVRRLFLLTAVVWFLGVVFVWPDGEPVGLTLVASGSHDQLVSIGGFDAQGRMVVTRLSRQQSAWPLGPISLHDARTGKQVSTLYSGDERIQELRIDRGLAVTRTDQAVRLVSLDDRILLEQAGQFQRRECPAQLSPGATRFLVHDGLKLTVYDVATAKVLWTHDAVRRASWADDDALHLWMESDSEREFVRASAVTGQFGPGNRKAFADGHEVRRSPDGRLAWWIGSGSPADDPAGLYDLQTNRLLWGMDVVRRNGMDPVRMRHLLFSSDSSELQYFYHLPEHRWGTARWRASDGECLAPLPANSSVSALRDFMAVAPDGRWGAYSKSVSRTRFAPIPAIVWQAPAWLSSPISRYLTATSPVVQVCDNVNNRLLASIPQKSSRLAADPDGSGLFMHGGLEITRYEVPPKMAHLKTWIRAGLPAAGFLLIGEMIAVAWQKRRRSLSDAPTSDLTDAKAFPAF